VAGDLISLLQQVLTTFLLVCIPNFAFWSSPYSCVYLWERTVKISTCLVCCRLFPH
jgi:hypothetical protein